MVSRSILELNISLTALLDLVDVDGLEEPRISEIAIDRLVMEQYDKDMIKAVAKTYTDRSQSGRFSADFIHGKGEGQVILLHGPPGTGKTLTAGMSYNLSLTDTFRMLNSYRICCRVHAATFA
jgi:SpoVK/Ycf46/Vps4 family AAA+-type ATPase